MSDRVTFKVGGKRFETTIATLTKFDDTYFSAMFSGRHTLKPDPDGSYFIDRDPLVFRYVLNYLRGDDLPLDLLSKLELYHLLQDAKYYNLVSLIEHFEPKQPKYPLIGSKFVEISPDRKTMTMRRNKECSVIHKCIVDMNLLTEKHEIKWSIHVKEAKNGIVNALVGIAFKDNPLLIDTYNCIYICGFGLKNNGLFSMNFNNKSTDFTSKIHVGDKITCIFNPTVGTLTFKVNDTLVSPSLTGIPLDRPLCPYIHSTDDLSCEVNVIVD
jgi:hypothetical protein